MLRGPRAVFLTGCLANRPFRPANSDIQLEDSARTPGFRGSVRYGLSRGVLRTRSILSLVALTLATAGLLPFPAYAGPADVRALGHPTALPYALKSVSPTSSPSIGRFQQGGGGPDSMQNLLAIGQLVLDIFQGKKTSGTEMLFQQSEESAAKLLEGSGTTDLFFLDFGNPDLRINEFAGKLAGNLLILTPLYVAAYLGMLVYNLWGEHPIPNPITFAVLVLGVMIFLAAFGVITQGLSELGRVLATSMGGLGDAMYARSTLLATITRVLANLRDEGGILSVLALSAAMVEGIIILVQLAYRGLSMAIWRLLGVLLIPLSVFAEGTNPRTAGRVISGFFEAWLDMVGKITLLLLVLSLAASASFASAVWFILPAGLLVVVLSWKFLGVLFMMIRDSVAHAWSSLSLQGATEPVGALPAAAEAARARDIDEERKRLIEE